MSKGTLSVAPSQSACASGTSKTYPPNRSVVTAAHAGASVSLSN